MLLEDLLEATDTAENDIELQTQVEKLFEKAAEGKKQEEDSGGGDR